MRNRIQLVALAAALVVVLLAVPAAAARDAAVFNGIDLWNTPGNGHTYSDFSLDPIPAGFFCAGSAAFDGRIVFRGVPVATEPAGVLGHADTVIQRLDDAIFTRRINPAMLRLAVRGPEGSAHFLRPGMLRDGDVAITRVQVRALSLEGVEPLHTACGSYHVTAALASGEQPTTDMVILRRGDGGQFYAPLTLDIRLSFTPENGGPSHELFQRVSFPARPDATWVGDLGTKGVRYEGFVKIDTDGDRQPDTLVPGTSNFAAGWRVKGESDGRVVAPAAAYTPYCDGIGTNWAEHCHGIVPVLPAVE